MAYETQHLDLLSTSQTNKRCAFGAPLVALIINGQPCIRYGCCNHWECPRCGEVRAKQEYRRIVHGCEVLSENHTLYFWTLTCRGRELSLEDAEENYYAWTNRLLTNARTKCKRQAHHWAYVQVTERQKRTRAHPHSHIITTFLPDDAVKTVETGNPHALVSQWFARANASAGLGSQHRISEIQTHDAVSRYVAKYLFKDTARDTFPKGWKRVRYSESFPKLPDWKPDYAQALNGKSDWYEIGSMNKIKWLCESYEIYEMARHRIVNIIQQTG